MLVVLRRRQVCLEFPNSGAGGLGAALFSVPWSPRAARSESKQQRSRGAHAVLEALSCSGRGAARGSGAFPRSPSAAVAEAALLAREVG